MERTHKFSLRWRGPYEVTKVLNPFQLQYHDEGRQKVTHVRNCKKFHRMANYGNERGKSKEEGLKQAKSQCQVKRRRAMTCYIVEVLEGGSRLTFQNPSHFR